MIPPVRVSLSSFIAEMDRSLVTESGESGTYAGNFFFAFLLAVRLGKVVVPACEAKRFRSRLQLLVSSIWIAAAKTAHSSIDCSLIDEDLCTAVVLSVFWYVKLAGCPFLSVLPSNWIMDLEWTRGGTGERGTCCVLLLSASRGCHFAPMPKI
jgi:hypothetical protein